MTPGIYCTTWTRTACVVVIDCDRACVTHWLALAGLTGALAVVAIVALLWAQGRAKW